MRSTMSSPLKSIPWSKYGGYAVWVWLTFCCFFLLCTVLRCLKSSLRRRISNSSCWSNDCKTSIGALRMTLISWSKRRKKSLRTLKSKVSNSMTFARGIVATVRLTKPRRSNWSSRKTRWQLSIRSSAPHLVSQSFSLFFAWFWPFLPFTEQSIVDIKNEFEPKIEEQKK